METNTMDGTVNSKVKIEKRIVALSAYAIAMAFVETAVVIYLRELYYPGGFFVRAAADLRVIPWEILRVELWREAATMVMLAAVGFLAFDKAKEKFWAFVFAFSLWDLFYYLFLYVFLRWPSSLSTTDVYFLIPRPWIGPVWFPLLLFGILGAVSLRKLLKLPAL